MKIEITTRLLVSDHDGYCSGDECQLSVHETKHVMDLDLDIKDLREIKEEFWITRLPAPDINTSGSYFCSNSMACQRSGLDIHDYKYEILSVKCLV